MSRRSGRTRRIPERCRLSIGIQNRSPIGVQKCSPGEWLIVCRTPLLADERNRKRREPVDSTAAEPEAVRRDSRPLKCAEKIRLRAEKILGKRRKKTIAAEPHPPVPLH